MSGELDFTNFTVTGIDLVGVGNNISPEHLNRERAELKEINMLAQAREATSSIRNIGGMAAVENPAAFRAAPATPADAALDNGTAAGIA